MDDFWQQVVKLVFKVSNLLFFSSTYATDKHRQAVVVWSTLYETMYFINTINISV